VTLNRFLEAYKGVVFRILFFGDKYQALGLPFIEPYILTDSLSPLLGRLVISESADNCKTVSREILQMENQ
jgi:hypothetical protein